MVSVRCDGMSKKMERMKDMKRMKKTEAYEEEDHVEVLQHWSLNKTKTHSGQH